MVIPCKSSINSPIWLYRPFPHNFLDIYVFFDYFCLIVGFGNSYHKLKKSSSYANGISFSEEYLLYGIPVGFCHKGLTLIDLPHRSLSKFLTFSSRWLQVIWVCTLYRIHSNPDTSNELCFIAIKISRKNIKTKW